MVKDTLRCHSNVVLAACVLIYTNSYLGAHDVAWRTGTQYCCPVNNHICGCIRFAQHKIIKELNRLILLFVNDLGGSKPWGHHLTEPIAMNLITSWIFGNPFAIAAVSSAQFFMATATSEYSTLCIDIVTFITFRLPIVYIHVVVATVAAYKPMPLITPVVCLINTEANSTWVAKLTNPSVL